MHWPQAWEENGSKCGLRKINSLTNQHLSNSLTRHRKRTGEDVIRQSSRISARSRTRRLSCPHTAVVSVESVTESEEALPRPNYSEEVGHDRHAHSSNNASTLYLHIDAVHMANDFNGGHREIEREKARESACVPVQCSSHASR